EQLRQGTVKSLRKLIFGWSVERNIELQALGPRGFRKTLQSEMLEDFAKPQSHLAALDDIRRRPWIEIKHHHRRTGNIFAYRERRMQFNRGQVPQPHQRR